LTYNNKAYFEKRYFTQKLLFSKCLLVGKPLTLGGFGDVTVLITLFAILLLGVLLIGAYPVLPFPRSELQVS
jgi:hypothetical protein